MRKIIVCSTILMMITASIFCCCFINPAEAELEVPSCHQTEPNQSADQNGAENCNCPELNSLDQKAASFDYVDVQITYLPVLIQQTFIQRVKATQSMFVNTGPPQQDIPLYIKHSILRV